MRWVVGKDYSSPHSFGPLPVAVLSLSLESNLSQKVLTLPDECKLSQSHRSYHIAVVNYVVGKIRTFEVDDGRFTVCSFGRSGTPPGNAFYWPAPYREAGRIISNDAPLKCYVEKKRTGCVIFIRNGLKVTSYFCWRLKNNRPITVNKDALCQYFV